MNSFTRSGFTNFMKMAIEQAKIAQSAGEVPVGAVLLGPAGDVLAKSGNTPTIFSPLSYQQA